MEQPEPAAITQTLEINNTAGSSDYNN